MAAVFSLANKLQPAIIFIDEVDSFLGQRRSTDSEAVTNMKTEFMALWDGFTTDRKLCLFTMSSHCYKCLRLLFFHVVGSVCVCSLFNIYNRGFN